MKKSPERSEDRLTNEQGLALVMTLLVVVLLTTLILEFDYSARTDLLAAKNFRDATKATYLAQSGVAAAKAVLRDDSRHSGEYDAYNELWAVPFPAYPVGDGTVTVSIQDEGGKLNPNDLVNPNGSVVEKKVLQMRMLFELIDVNPDIVNAIIDWIDPDSIVSTPGGAEEDYYNRQAPPYSCKNSKLSLLSELHRIRGITDEVYQQISPYLTVYSDSSSVRKQGPINVNTADALILQSLPSSFKEEEFPITEDVAQKIMEARPIKKCEELDKIAGVSNEVKGKIIDSCVEWSKYFTITSSGDVDGLIKTVRAVVKREGSRIKTLFWKME